MSKLQQYSPRGSRQRHGSVSLSIVCPRTDGPNGVDSAGKTKNTGRTVVTCWLEVKSEEISTPSKRALPVALSYYFTLVRIHLERPSIVYGSHASFQLGDGVGCV